MKRTNKFISNTLAGILTLMPLAGCTSSNPNTQNTPKSWEEKYNQVSQQSDKYAEEIKLKDEKIKGLESEVKSFKAGNIELETKYNRSEELRYQAENSASRARCNYTEKDTEYNNLKDDYLKLKDQLKQLLNPPEPEQKKSPSIKQESSRERQA